MKLRIALFAALALASAPLGGCAAIQAASAPAAAFQGTAIDEKAMYAAEALYNVPAQAYVTAYNNGLLTPELEKQLKPKMHATFQALQAVREAYRLGNATDFQSKVEVLTKLSTELQTLIPK